MLERFIIIATVRLVGSMGLDVIPILFHGKHAGCWMNVSQMTPSIMQRGRKVLMTDVAWNTVEFASGPSLHSKPGWRNSRGRLMPLSYYHFDSSPMILRPLQYIPTKTNLIPLFLYTLLRHIFEHRICLLFKKCFPLFFNFLRLKKI